jgi:hypothetical protein
LGRPSLTRDNGIALTGPSRRPDPTTNAYRPDLADCALAHEVIASHYAQPLERVIARAATLRARPSNEAEIVAEIPAGEPFSMLDNSLGWAWGYAGKDRRVGYVLSGDIRLPD